MFRDKELPNIDIKLEDIPIISQELIGRMSISGVQKKISLKLDKKNNLLVIAPIDGEFILKPQLDQWKQVPENENLTMTLANIFKIETAKHLLIKLADNTNAYLVRRFDRENKNKKAFEDFAQLLEIAAEDKYNVSVEKIAKTIDKYSAAPGIDKLCFYRMLIFNYLIGNTDAHVKNYGLLEESHGYRLSPAYDLVNTKLIILNEKEETALSINGKRKNLTINDFNKVAKNFGVSNKARDLILNDIRDLADNFILEINQSELTKVYKDKYIDIYMKNLSIFK